MANSDTPRGFRPYGELLHVGIYVASGTIYPGDAVEQHTGTAVSTLKRVTCVVANAGPLLGVALNYATAGQSVRVADDPSQLFAVNSDSAEPSLNDDLGLNATLVATAGDSTYKVSRHEIAAGDTTATSEFKVLGIVDRQDGKNTFGSTGCECIVKINNHQLGSSTGTAGV